MAEGEDAVEADRRIQLRKIHEGMEGAAGNRRPMPLALSFCQSGMTSTVPAADRYRAQLRLFDTAINFGESRVPTAVTEAMITSAIKPAINTYSTATAALSSC
jgi:hypothetical protein